MFSKKLCHTSADTGERSFGTECALLLKVFIEVELDNLKDNLLNTNKLKLFFFTQSTGCTGVPQVLIGQTARGDQPQALCSPPGEGA